mmetsp:Transcript_25691/g.64511  ORF Transcript_25691/g.64511 Transcript_25691/m.64511 type:complete len:421 (-) Transcript_25691:25-1287(-)
MPELPEIVLYAKRLNAVGYAAEYVHPSKPVRVHLKAIARGKELLLHCHDVKTDRIVNSYLVQHGLSGGWEYDPPRNVVEKSQLVFYRGSSKSSSCICFRSSLGAKIVEADSFSADRSPCPYSEYDLWEQNLLKKVRPGDRKKMLCEVMLDQRLFNGIGNYLRAEICAHAGLAPFQSFGAVLQDPNKCSALTKNTHLIPSQVVALGLNKYGNAQEQAAFHRFLICYEKQPFRMIAGRKMYYMDPAKQAKTADKPTGSIAHLQAVLPNADVFSTRNTMPKANASFARSDDGGVARKTASTAYLPPFGSTTSVSPWNQPTPLFAASLPATGAPITMQTDLDVLFPVPAVPSLSPAAQILLLNKLLRDRDATMHAWVKEVVIRQREPYFSILHSAVEAYAADPDHDLDDVHDTFQRVKNQRCAV